MASNAAEDETQQLLRTVEMFEAITESQPDDYQSLEILKEAYTKLNRQEDSLVISRKLARAYAGVGQISQAILEYEGILQERPDDPAVRAALAELDARTAPHGGQTISGVLPTSRDSKPTPPSSTLAVGAGAPPPLYTHPPVSDGDAALAEVLIAEKLLTRASVHPLLQQLRTQRAAALEKNQPLTLVQLLVDEQICKLDDILLVLVNRSGLPYLPLSAYDLDRDIAHLLPREIAFQLCVLPFDRISHSVLVATTNPFDDQARDQVRAMLNYSVLWYVTPPEDIVIALRRLHGIDNTARKS